MRIFCVQCGMRIHPGTEHFITPSYTGCRPPLIVRFCESTGARLNMPPPDPPNLYASSLTDAAEKAPAFK